MNITLDIPVNDDFRPVLLKELQKELTEHASLWLKKFARKEASAPQDFFTLPKEFEALCGSISLQDVEKARKDDPMLDAIMEKYK